MVVLRYGDDEDLGRRVWQTDYDRSRANVGDSRRGCLFWRSPVVLQEYASQEQYTDN